MFQPDSLSKMIINLIEDFASFVSLGLLDFPTMS